MQVEDIQYYFSAGLSCAKEGKYDLAIENLIKAIEINPNYSQIYYNLGIVYSNINQNDLAIENFKKAIELEPKIASIYTNLGVAYAKNEQYDLALENYEKALALAPDSILIYINLANVYASIDDHDNAINFFKKIIELDSDNAYAYQNLGVLFYKKGDIAEAIKYNQKALELEPKNIIVINNQVEVYLKLGNIYKKENEFDNAISCYQKALDLNPQDAETLKNLGVAFSKIGNYSQSIENYKKILELEPENFKCFLNLGLAYYNNRDYEKAIESYNKTIELNPDYPEARIHLAVVYFTIGEYEKGWELYEWRLLGEKVSVPVISKPKWNGDNIKCKTLLVYPEQGFGDTIMFSRYIPLLSEIGATVLFKPQIELERLYKMNNLGSEIINKLTSYKNIKFDEHTSVMSLAGIFKTNINNIPYSEGYLKADPEKINYYKNEYFDNNLFKVGIFWQANQRIKLNKSAKLADFYPLSQIPNVKLYSFQKGEGIEHLEAVPENIEIIDLGSTFNDFSDTAAAIENIDLLITVDTSVAHLGGALNKPVWILLHIENEWRWLKDREDSPWYKSIRLFRQKYRGNWDEVMERVCNNLAKICC